MKRYISINSKYYKHSNASGELGHVDRHFHKNKNSFDNLTHLNFGSGDLLAEYQALRRKAESQKGKKMQSNSNTFVDSVVAFSRDQMNELMEKHPGDWQEKIDCCFAELGNKIRDKYGFEPVGYNMHMDEGHEDPETGEIKNNYHAHMTMFNYDFVTGKAPLRSMKKKDWGNLQDLAGEAFESLGFKRGNPQGKKKKRHLEKDEYIHEKQKETERALIAANQVIIANDRLIDYQNEKIEVLKKQKSGIISGGNKVVERTNKAMRVMEKISQKITDIMEMGEYVTALNYFPEEVVQMESELKRKKDGWLSKIWKLIKGKSNEKKTAITQSEQRANAKKIAKLDREFAGLQRQARKDQEMMRSSVKGSKMKPRNEDDKYKIKPK